MCICSLGRQLKAFGKEPEAFHRIFFAEGTWIFLRSDTLIRLFPIQFWIDVAVTAVVMLVAEAILIAFVGWVWRRQLNVAA